MAIIPMTKKSRLVFWISVRRLLVDAGGLQKVYTRDYKEVISLSFEKDQNCLAIFIGTNHRERFDNLVDQLEVDWLYLSTEDMDDEEEEDE